MRASELRGTSSLPYFFTKCENQECPPLGEGRGAAAPLLSVKLTAFCIDLSAVGQAGRRKATRWFTSESSPSVFIWRQAPSANTGF